MADTKAPASASVFTIDPVPRSVDSELAEWLRRQFQRLSSSSYIGTEIQTIIAPPTGQPSVLNHTQLADMAANPVTNPHGMMRWLGEWVGGDYLLYDVVTDDDYLAIANKATSDKPAPYAIDDPEFARFIPGAPPAFTVNNVTASSIFYLQRYTFPSDNFVQSILYYIPAGNEGLTAEVWIVLNPTSATPDYQSVIAGFTVTASDVDEWQEFPIGNKLIRENTTFDVAVVLRSTTAPIQLTTDYDYRRNNGIPGAGQIFHDSSGLFMRVNYLDAGLTDQSAFLANMVAGSRIEAGGTTYSVLADGEDLGTYFEFEVQPQTRLTPGVYSFTFTYYGTLPIFYPVVPNWFVAQSNIKGSVDTEYDPDEVVLDDNLYGVDIKVAEAVISDDWDLLAFSGGSGVSGGGSGGAVNSVSGTNSVNASPTIGDVVVQLEGDGTPTLNQYYGTDGTGSRGYYDLPTGGGGAVDSVTGADSVIVTPTTGDTVVSLLNDQTAPGNSQYYGTDSGGVKGYYALPTNGGGGSGETLIQEIDATGIEEIIFNIPTVYVRYRLQYDGVVPTAEPMRLRLRYSTDNGTSYVATGYQYAMGVHTPTTSGFDGSANTQQFFVSGNMGSGPEHLEANGEFSIFGLNRRMSILGSYWTNELLEVQYIRNMGGCVTADHTQVTNLRVAANAGQTFASGTFRLYGI